MNLSVNQIVNITNGELFCGDKDLVLTTYTKDTREINVGDTYIGIKGENFDGNNYYKDAFEKGAIACIIEKEYFKTIEGYEYNKPIILVNNSKDALRDIASYIRNNSSAHFVGVTGSVGKTSTRDMIYSVVKENYSSIKTEGNFNNAIGLPLTIMRLDKEDAAVIEMGMSELGEISYLSKITRPHISVITNVGTAHIGNLGSRENILKAKLEILDGMDESATLVINNDNDMLHSHYLKDSKNIVTFGIDEESDATAINLELNDNNSEFDIKYKNEIVHVYCPIPGKAFVYNSLAAFVVGKLLNIDNLKILNGIKNFELTKNRMEIIDSNGIKIINGVYNASVDSMKSNIDILMNQVGDRKIAILGSMLELGEFSKELHEEVGSYIAKKNVDILITVGDDAKFIASKAVEEGMNENMVYAFDKNEDAIELLKNTVKNGDALLLKASNGLNFKQILNELIEFTK